MEGSDPARRGRYGGGVLGTTAAKKTETPRWTLRIEDVSPRSWAGGRRSRVASAGGSVFRAQEYPIQLPAVTPWSDWENWLPFAAISGKI